MTAWAVAEHMAPLQKIELPIPEPTGTEILVKVTHCGVCHSDLHFWEGFYEVRNQIQIQNPLPRPIIPLF
jgi:propanol-preferring alcohol dehydrogenase